MDTVGGFEANVGNSARQTINIKIDRRGNPVILDFADAKRVRVDWLSPKSQINALREDYYDIARLLGRLGFATEKEALPFLRRLAWAAGAPKDQLDEIAHQIHVAAQQAPYR